MCSKRYHNTRPALSQFWRLKIRRSTFLSYSRFAYFWILSRYICQKFDRAMSWSGNGREASNWSFNLTEVFFLKKEVLSLQPSKIDLVVVSLSWAILHSECDEQHKLMSKIPSRRILMTRNRSSNLLQIQIPKWKYLTSRESHESLTCWLDLKQQLNNPNACSSFASKHFLLLPAQLTGIRREE